MYSFSSFFFDADSGHKNKNISEDLLRVPIGPEIRNTRIRDEGLSKKEVAVRRGFTLLELMIVIIIIGTLATLGVMQYAGAIEKARGAEAKQCAGAMRSQCAAYYMEDGDGARCLIANIGVGVPTACATTHFFSYAVTSAANGFVMTGTRCTASGKSPQGATAGTLILTTDFSAGTDVWSGTGGY